MIGWRSWPSQARKVTFCPLNAARSMVRAADHAIDRSEIGGVRPRGSFADGAHRDPGLIVDRPHQAVGETLEAVLHLGRAPLLMRRVPAHGIKTCGAGDRPRVPGAERQIVAEHVALVGDDQHVVVGRVLGEDRHLPLDLQVAGV